MASEPLPKKVDPDVSDDQGAGASLADPYDPADPAVPPGTFPGEVTDPEPTKRGKGKYVAVDPISHGYGTGEKFARDVLQPGDALVTSHFSEADIDALLASGAIRRA